MITGLNRAGAETQMVRLATGLVERGHRVTVISIIEPTHFVDELGDTGVHVITLHARAGSHDPRLILRTARHLRNIQPEILVTFMFHANLLGRLAGKLAGVKSVIGSIRGEKFGQGGWSLRTLKVRSREFAVRLSAPLSTAMTTNSSLLARRLVRKGIVSAGKLHVIPNILDLAETRKLGNKSILGLELPDSAFLWMNVARFNPVKDHGTLLRAFKLHAERTELPVHLVLVGGGSLFDPFKELADQLGVGKRVHFLGERIDVPDLLAIADGFVLSSISEGLPNVLIEAHAAGLPVVSTNVGGVSEVVLDGRSGFLVPPSSPEELADAMDKLFRMSLEQRQEFGRLGQEHVTRQFDKSAVLDRWEALFAAQC